MLAILTLLHNQPLELCMRNTHFTSIKQLSNLPHPQVPGKQRSTFCLYD